MKHEPFRNAPERVRERSTHLRHVKHHMRGKDEASGLVLLTGNSIAPLVERSKHSELLGIERVVVPG